jgi:hypothetical protein
MRRILPQFQKLPTKPVCQSDIKCNRQPLANKPWCSYHACNYRGRQTRRCKYIISPTSGFEPILDINKWNNNIFLKDSHNCFAYAIDTIDPEIIKECKLNANCDVGFPQPGYESGYSSFSKQKDKGCGDMVSRLWGDNPMVQATRFETICPNGTSKIALIVDPSRDYHFLRQDKDGYWSHKPGSLAVKRVDASDRPIIRPDKAIFLYNNKEDPLMYTDFCGYFCVPRGKSLHMSKIAKGGGIKKKRLSEPSVSHGSTDNRLRLQRYYQTRRLKRA